MTAHHPLLLDRDRALFRVYESLLVALVDLNEYLYALALSQSAARSASGVTSC
jgi:hypothetical protein